MVLFFVVKAGKEKCEMATEKILKWYIRCESM